MVGHNHGDAKIDSFAVVVNTMLKNGGPGGIRERLANQSAKRHEQGGTGILKVRQPPPVVVLASQDAGIGHEPYSNSKPGNLSVTHEHGI